MGLASRWNVWRDRNQRDSRPQKKRSRTSLFRILDTFRQFRPAPTYDTRENNARLRVASIQSREKKCQTSKISLTTVTFLLELNTRRIYSHIREKDDEKQQKRGTSSRSRDKSPRNPETLRLWKRLFFFLSPSPLPSRSNREKDLRGGTSTKQARARVHARREPVLHTF